MENLAPSRIHPAAQQIQSSSSSSGKSLTSEQTAIPEGLTKLPTVESCDEGGADVVFESRGSNHIWLGVGIRFQTWLFTHNVDLRWVAVHDRVSGKTHRPLVIGS